MGLVVFHHHCDADDACHYYDYDDQPVDHVYGDDDPRYNDYDNFTCRPC